MCWVRVYLVCIGLYVGLYAGHMCLVCRCVYGLGVFDMHRVCAGVFVYYICMDMDVWVCFGYVFGRF